MESHDIVPMTPAQVEFFSQFYKKYERFVHFVALNHTHDAHDLADTMQDSWYRLMKQVETLMESDEHGQLGYISRTVETAYIDLCRKRNKILEPWNDELYIEQDEKKWDMVSDLHLRDQLKILREELSERDWYTLVGKYYYKYSNEELGLQINVKPNSLRTILCRIREKARNILNARSLLGGGGYER